MPSCHNRMPFLAAADENNGCRHAPKPAATSANATYKHSPSCNAHHGTAMHTQKQQHVQFMPTRHVECPCQKKATTDFRAPTQASWKLELPIARYLQHLRGHIMHVLVLDIAHTRGQIQGTPCSIAAIRSYALQVIAKHSVMHAKLLLPQVASNI